MSKIKINTSFIIVLFLLLWMDSGLVSLLQLRYIPFLIFFFLWLVVSLYKKRINIASLLKYCSLLFVYIFTIMPTIALTKENSRELIQAIDAIICISILLYGESISVKDKKKIIYLLFIDKIIVNIYSIIKCIKYPDIIRILSQGSQSIIAKYGSTPVMLADYGFVYVIPILLIYIFFNYDKIKKQGPLFFSLIWIFIISSIILVFVASFTILIIVGTIFVFICILLKKSKRFEFKVIEFVAMFFLIINIPTLVEKIAYSPFITNTLSLKFRQVSDYISGGNASNLQSIQSRVNVYNTTMAHFFENFLFGLLESPNIAKLNLGMHTEWIDRICLIGIFRYGFFLSWLFIMQKKIGKQMTIEWKIVVWYVIIIGFLNWIINRQLYISILILIPFLNDVLSKKDIRGVS